ncbi:PAS domain-containing protein, partial [Singulisphaera rosea]
MNSVIPLHILVIEDDADTRANLRDILELDDHKVESVGTAAEALARDDWSRFSAIILDRKLPDATADELLPRIRHEAPAADVIVVTGYSDLQGAVSALRQGATDYILKPISPDDLRSRLGRIAAGQQAGLELKRQSEIIHSLMASASDAIVVADPEGRVQLYNPAAKRLIGPIRVAAPAQEWAHVGCVRQADTGSTDSPREIPLYRALRGEQVVDEQVFVTQPGAAKSRWMSVNASPIYDCTDIKGAVVIYRDITERKRAEEELRRAAERFGLLVQNSSDIITVLSVDGAVLYQSASIERLLGYRPFDRVGRNIFRDPIVHPDDLAKKREFLDEAIHRPGMPVTTEFRLQHADGTWRHFEAVGQNLLDDPSVGAIVANYRDITERRRAEERAIRA